MITIVDYGLGNLGSVKNMFQKIGFESVKTSELSLLEKATKLVLPGVGSFDAGMRQIHKLGIKSLLDHKALEERVPVLGICLGAQLMTQSSEEGREPGLGWFDAETIKIPVNDVPGKWPLPNIGWRDVYPKLGYDLLDSQDTFDRFYFVHSYMMMPNDPSLTSAASSYGVDFACGLHRDNLHCVQFHPEKSHRYGFNFFRKFVALQKSEIRKVKNFCLRNNI